MKIWTLIENTACEEAFAAEHGLSLYLETGGRRILFDMGASAAFADNAEKMGVDLEKVDTAVLSHGHCDHGGGMKTFLDRNTHAKIHVSPLAFARLFNKKGEEIGLDPALQGHPRIALPEDFCEGEGFSLHSCNDLTPIWSTDPRGLAVEKNGERLPDDFRHEQYLLVHESGKRILISGCSHKGIVNLVHWFRPDVLVGGFHLKDMAVGSPEIDRIAHALLSYPTVYYTGHCTGEGQYRQLKHIMGDRLHAFSSGMVLEI